jgi:hypothetical protein
VDNTTYQGTRVVNVTQKVTSSDARYNNKAVASVAVTILDTEPAPGLAAAIAAATTDDSRGTKKRPVGP